MSDKCKHGIRDTATNLPYCRRCDEEAKDHSLHRPGSPASFDAGVWFQSACSGLWYQVRNAGGDISAVKIDGVIYRRQENVRLRRSGEESKP